MDQLGQTPSKISILSFVLSSESHIIALVKVLNESHVMHDINFDQFDRVVTNITASQYLGFNDVELPAKELLTINPYIFLSHVWIHSYLESWWILVPPLM